MTILTVGPNKMYATIAAAAAAARNGDTVDVSAGTYVNDFAVVRTQINLVAIGGLVTDLATVALPNGGGILTVTATATVSGFVLSGATSADGTAAGLLDTGGALVLQGSLIEGNQQGLVVRGGPTASVVVQGSELAHNGNNDGFSGNVSVFSAASLSVQNSFIHDALGGDEIKSLAAATTITGTRIEDGSSASAVDVDLPNAGNVQLTGDTIEKGAASTNAVFVRLGGGTPSPGSSTTIAGSTFVNDSGRAATVLANTTSVQTNVNSNQVFGLASGVLASGPAALSANTVDTVRPAVSATSLIVPAIAVPVEYGRAGAVNADGTVLTVGIGKTYATLAAALLAAHDGDTIDVQAGTYAISPTTIAHRVTIEGVGGMGRFVEAGPMSGQALFLTTADATFRNVEITGAAEPGGVSAGIEDAGGNLTVVNCDIHDNQAGIVVDDAPGIAVGIYDTEVARNGTVDGRGGNVAVGNVGTLTLRDDWMHDAVAGAEVSSKAENATLDVDRISQAAGSGAADLALPNGGRVSITGSAFEKGASSRTAPLIDAGGGATYAGSAISIAGTTLISDQAFAPTRFVVAEAGSAPVNVSNAVFVGGSIGSAEVVGGTNVGATTATGLMVATATPWTPPSASVLAVAGGPAGPITATVPFGTPAEHGILKLYISEDAYHGDAQFSIAIDGVDAAGTLTAIASHAAGQTEVFVTAGVFAAGPHAVTVKYLNDVQAAGANPGRNLYVDGMTFNSVDSHHATKLSADGAVTFTTSPITQMTAIAVNLSEDAWKGDAMAFVTVDGTVQGGVQTVTASHAAGATEAISLLLGLPSGAHTVGVTFLNPAGPGAAGAARSLYVDSIDVAGQHFGAAAAALHTGSTSSFAFNVSPAPAANANLFVTSNLPIPLTPILY